MYPLSRRLIDRAPRRARPAVELVLRTGEDALDDRVPGLAAEVAFFVLLSLPPLLVTLLAAVGLVGDLFEVTWREELIVQLRAAAGVVFSQDTVEGTLSRLFDALVRTRSGSLFGIGFLLTLVSASRALRVITVAITIAYDLEAERPAWKQRLWGFGLTVVAVLLGVAVVPLFLAGPRLGAIVSDWLGGVPGLAATWELVYWPLALTVPTLLIAALYHFAAPWRTPFVRDLPGAALAVLLWLAGSGGLRLYVAQTIAGEAVYQPIAGPLVLLLWLYVSAFAVLLGAELNAEIEKLWPTRPRITPAMPGRRP